MARQWLPNGVKDRGRGACAPAFFGQAGKENKVEGQTAITVLLVLIALLAAAGTTVSILSARAAACARRRNRTEWEQLTEEIQEKLDSSTVGMRADLGVQLSNSVRSLGELLSGGQQTASAAQSAGIASLERQLYSSQAALSDALRSGLSENARTLEAMREETARSMRELREDNTKQLNQIRTTVDEQLQSALEKKMTESFRQVSDRLEQVYRGLGEMQTLATGVGDLKKMLGNVKTRGILGEIQLGAILAEILSPEQYLTDVATVPGSRNRVEFAIRLPGEDGAVLLPVDSKFPMDAYTQLQDAIDGGDPQQVKAAGAVLESRLRAFAKDIRDKYISPPATTAFGIMFLPTEGLYAEAVNRGLCEALQREYNISVAGPSTMAALLNALQMGFRTLALQKRSQEVWQLLGAVRTEFDRFTEVLLSAQKRLQLAGDDLDKLVGVRTRAINRQLRAVEKLDTETAHKILDE